jgi:murein L,D-transpeptidase YafK
MNRTLLIIIAPLLLCNLLSAQDFLSVQLGNERVKQAKLRVESRVEKMFLDSGLGRFPKYIYWRAFKLEDELELWASDSTTKAYKLIKTYKICRGSGDLGPKRKMGDKQVPEGMYFIERYNPNSNYHLSMKVSYPNEADLMAADKENPGNEIYIHGDCVSIGCLPMTDTLMQEIYWITLRAQAYQGVQSKIPIDIFPCRFNKKNWEYLTFNYRSKTQTINFWKNIEEAYQFFNTHRIPPGYWVDEKGRYHVVFPQNFHLHTDNH